MRYFDKTNSRITTYALYLSGVDSLLGPMWKISRSWTAFLAGSSTDNGFSKLQQPRDLQRLTCLKSSSKLPYSRFVLPYEPHFGPQKRFRQGGQAPLLSSFVASVRETGGPLRDFEELHVLQRLTTSVPAPQGSRWATKIKRRRRSLRRQRSEYVSRSTTRTPVQY